MGRKTKDDILKAAVRVFAEKGYVSGTVREIVGLAGTSNLNVVVYNFGGKEGLYSISAQIMYYAFAWSIISRTCPGHVPPESQIEELSEHVIRFSLGGCRWSKPGWRVKACCSCREKRSRRVYPKPVSGHH